MLFNSYTFILIFLPIVLAGYFLFGTDRRYGAMVWLTLASLIFYGWWDTRFVSLLLISVIFNYTASLSIFRSQALARMTLAKGLLALAIAVDLLLLGYYKYAYFLAENVSNLFGVGFTVQGVILPLGISFFTFTQIAYLVDTLQGKVNDRDFVHYLLFVTYFPHLIAGPVLHHKEMMPQFSSAKANLPDWTNITVGASIFVLGLAKKVLIADNLSGFATPIFDAVAAGGQPMLLESWIGALAYTMQLYFDFSAYSDMAVGISLMFNIRLPVNFNTPYKSTSIIEFWKNWHITLSRFLRDYLYIPLGGNRRGSQRRHINLMVTMLLGGLWHGANWTFVVWGALHGGYLIVNHAWRAIKQELGWGDGGRVASFFAWALTFIAVVIGWVFFRAADVGVALDMLRGMMGLNGLSLPASLQPSLSVMSDPGWLKFDGAHPLNPKLNNTDIFLNLGLALLIATQLPNVRQMFRAYQPVYEDISQLGPPLDNPHPVRTHILWAPTRKHAWLFGLIFAISLMSLNRMSEFIYFQF
ncbi:MAG: MBOAT family protein [Gallionella sp.]|nr:MBOAT family protein [Gallionella sp.]